MSLAATAIKPTVVIVTTMAAKTVLAVTFVKSDINKMSPLFDCLIG